MMGLQTKNLNSQKELIKMIWPIDPSNDLNKNTEHFLFLQQEKYSTISAGNQFNQLRLMLVSI